MTRYEKDNFDTNINSSEETMKNLYFVVPLLCGNQSGFEFHSFSADRYCIFYHYRNQSGKQPLPV
jgi:hypothetical protein